MSQRKRTKGAKKAEASEPESGEEAAVLTYMQEQNRPYSFQNIFDNLKGQIKKTSGLKATEHLVSLGKLLAKDFGKARLYLLNQSLLPAPDQATLDHLDEAIHLKTQELLEIKQDVRTNTQLLRDLSSQMTDEQLAQALTHLRTEIAHKREQVAQIESGQVPQVSSSARAEAEQELQAAKAFEVKRRRLAKDMLGALAENSEMKLAELRVKIGLD